MEAAGVAVGGAMGGLDALEQIETASRELIKRGTVPEVVETALALAIDLDTRLFGDRDGDLVGQRQRLEDGAQVVVTVLAQVPDRQVQVDLGRYADGDRWGYDG